MQDLLIENYVIRPGGYAGIPMQVYFFYIYFNLSYNHAVTKLTSKFSYVQFTLISIFSSAEVRLKDQENS